MKKLIYIIPAVILIMVGCKDNSGGNNTPKASLELSKLSVSFDEFGGSSVVSVVTNMEAWQMDQAVQWANCQQIENGIKITAPKFDGQTRDGYVYLSVPGTEPLLRDSIYVKQVGISNKYTNLSAQATANSYIAKPNTYYVFDATVRGNGNTNFAPIPSDNGPIETAMTWYLGNIGIHIEGGAAADLLWEATFNGDRTKSSQIIELMPFYRDGKIYFGTGKIEGNAVIAVKNAEGIVLWSWHIWVINDEISNKAGKNSYVWMDRNLGALNNNPGDDINNRGMVYQWGRKDPFLPTTMSYNQAYGTLQQTENMQVGKGSGKWNMTYQAQITIKYPGNILNSIYYPMNYIKSRVPGQDWIIDPGVLDRISFLWGDMRTSFVNKTIFDPCPPGYAVPPRDAWQIDDVVFENSVENKAGNDYGSYWMANNEEFFPYAGRSSFLLSQLYSAAGNEGTYWTSNVYWPVLGSQNMDIYSHQVVIRPSKSRITHENRGNGNSVRCVVGGVGEPQ